jgi:4-hydroxy-2-oxoheptanedioate aldolase
MIPAAFVVEILGDCAFDFLMIDRQHGLIGYERMVEMLQALTRFATLPLVRVASNDPAEIGRVLDAGARGIVVPMISSQQDAARAVAASMYPPRGSRSMGPIRAGMLYKGSPDHVDEQILRFMLIESKAGAAAAREICAYPGVGGVMVGAVDLALDLGLAVGTESEELNDAIANIVAAATENGIPAMIGVSSLEEARRRISEGFRMLMLGTDHWLLRGSALDFLSRAKDLY